MPNSSLLLPMQTQKQPNWCWAAVAASVADFYKGRQPWTQCRLANRAFNTTTCCKSGSSNECDRPYVLKEALGWLGHFKQTIHGSLRWSKIDRELGRGRPIGMRVQLLGGGSHYRLIVGSRTKRDKVIRVSDPEGMVIEGPRSVIAKNVSDQWAETIRTKP